MAIINNNVQSVKFLRNGSLFTPSADPVKSAREVALAAMEAQKNNLADGVAILGRYQETGGTVKTLVGFAYISGDTKTLTVFDVEGASADVQELREEINAKLGGGVSSANTVTAQLTALSGNSSTDTSATTSVEGAKRYADAKISDLDYTGVTTGTGVYVTNVTEADGVVSATTATLPTVTGEVESKKVVMSVSEDKGEISVTKGDIVSTDKTVKISNVTDGEDNITGINLETNIDGVTLQKNENGVISVTSSALVQYEGDDDTIQISAVSQGVRTVSSPLTIEKVTTGLDADVREAYRLVGHSGNTIGDLVKIYKDSSLLSVALLHADTTANPQVLPTYNKETDTWADISTPTEANQALCFAYENVSGTTVIAAVPVGAFINEQEFASGITWDSAAGKVKGVVDPTSETFLTVGDGGFKLSGVQDAIDAAVSGLDATVSAETAHVTVKVDEVDGKLTAVTLTESDIANATDLATLSGKTITVLTSANESITIGDGTAQDDGTIGIDLITDASKIKMSGFTSTDALSGITTSDSISGAFEKVDAVITGNEQVTSAALNDLDARIRELSGDSSSALTAEIAARKAVDGINGNAYTANTSANYISAATSLNDADQKLDAAIKVVEGDLDVVETNYVSGMTVNGSALTKSDRVLAVTVTPATSATTATSTEAITVQTDANGNITLGIANIDCGYYDGTQN